MTTHIHRHTETHSHLDTHIVNSTGRRLLLVNSDIAAASECPLDAWLGACVCMSVYLLCRIVQMRYTGLVHTGQSAALMVLLPRKWPLCSHPGIWLLRPNETLDSDTAVKAHMYAHTYTNTHSCVNEWTVRELLSSCLFPLSSCSINATPPEKVGADWLAKARSCCPLWKGQEVMDFGLVPAGPGQLSN